MLRLLSPLQKEDDAMLDTSDSRTHGSPNGSSKNGSSPLDMNIYATRKTVAQGMMVMLQSCESLGICSNRCSIHFVQDIALMTANASQLKYVLIHPASHRYFEVIVSLISLSILLQIVVGMLLIFLGRWNVNFRSEHRKCDMANNLVVILIFLITVVNVMISSFGPNGPSSRSSPAIIGATLPSSSPFTLKLRELSPAKQWFAFKLWFFRFFAWWWWLRDYIWIVTTKESIFVHTHWLMHLTFIYLFFV